MVKGLGRHSLLAAVSAWCSPQTNPKGISETHKVSCYRFYEEHKAEAAADGKDDMTAFGKGGVSA